jgi:hypothetical protein
MKTSGGRSVGIVRFRTKATEFSLAIKNEEHICATKAFETGSLLLDIPRRADSYSAKKKYFPWALIIITAINHVTIKIHVIYLQAVQKIETEEECEGGSKFGKTGW